MTPTRTQIETAGLVLAKIATADQWAAKPDTAMAITWAECFNVHNLQRPDLLAAVIALYADTTRDKTNRTLPADVIRHARRIRQARMETEKSTGHIERAALSPERRAIHDCPTCDPNGWIPYAAAGVTRCHHNQAITQ